MSKMKQIRWQEPPARTRKTVSGPKDRLITAVKKNPGQWLVYARNMKGTYPQSIRRKYPELTVVARRSKIGKGVDVYLYFPKSTITEEV
jgi:hypothetical protein